MHNLTVVIPTRNRLVKLEKTLESIPQLDYITTHVICDGDKDTFNFLNDNYSIRTTLINEHMGAVFCRNQILQHCNDGILYATDDVIFHTNSIQNAYKTFNDTFPDDDGVVGFVQEPGEFHPVGVALVGQKFLSRYPNKQLFNPGYFHFACQEIFWLCEHLGNHFIQDPLAVLTHKHPCKFREEMDQTHRDARIRRQEDHKLIKDRQVRGLIWGMQ